MSPYVLFGPAWVRRLRVARYGGPPREQIGRMIQIYIYIYIIIYTREMRQPTRVTGSLRSQLILQVQILKIVDLAGINWGNFVNTGSIYSKICDKCNISRDNF